MSGNSDSLRKPKRRKRRLLLFGIPAALLVLLAVSAEVTSSSRFCSSCHYMKPFYESWETSTHNEVQCKVCHYPPGFRSFFRTKIEGLVMVGRYWTKLYTKSKPWAEIQDESCLRPGCHDRQLLEGEVPFSKIIFSHVAHFEDLKRGKQLRCTSCHSQIVQGEHITVTAESCYLCHFKDKDDSVRAAECAVCHRKDDVLATRDRFDHAAVYENDYRCASCHGRIVSGEGDVPLVNCYKCHFERDRLEKYDDTDLMHRAHIASSKIECEQCHTGIQHRIVKDIETIADCRACHTGTHQAQKILYAGEGGKGIAHPMPNLMLERGLSCQGCHILHEQSGRLITSETLAAGAASCESCHGPGFDRILRNWEAATKKRLAELRAVARRAEAEVRAAAGSARAEAEARFQEALFNIDLVDKGKSVHNMAYSQALLSAAFEKIRESLATAGSSYKPEAPLLLSRESPGSCLNCHEGIEEIGTSAFGLAFSHKVHTVRQKMDCGVCHSNARKHGELTATRTSCAACHHEQPAKRECASCHTLQKAVYKGGKTGSLEIPGDIMAEADASCTDCHLDDSRSVVRPGAGPCVACHGEEYRKTFEEWREAVRKRLAEVRAALHELYKKPLSVEGKEEIRKIEEGLRLIELDGSSGIHNYLFTDDFLTEALRTIRSLNPEKERTT